MTGSSHPAINRARCGIAAKLARPFSDVDAKAAEILDALQADGWRPPVASSRPDPYRREHVQPADPETAAEALAGMRRQLAEHHHNRVQAEPETDPEEPS